MSSSKPEYGQFLASVPFLMAGGLVLGTLTAVGHHIFATQVNGNAVESNEQQGWYISIVTGLAFLTKAFLSASAGLAYTQLLWFILRSKTFTLDGVDATFSLVNNPWSFLKWELWSNGLSLVFMATIVWAIPIIAVFAPGTLTVQPSAEPNVTLVQRPISSLNYSAVRQFGQIGGGAGGGANLGYQGPSSRLSRLVATVVPQGAVLNPRAPYANCSYHLRFYGPSISCGDATSTNTTRIAAMVNPHYQADLRPFASFVPQDCGYYSNETDSAICGLNLTLAGPKGARPDTTYDSISEDHARMYVVVPEQTLGATNFGWSANKTIECGLFNTSYEVEFSSENGQLNPVIKKATRLNDVAGHYARMSNITCHDQSHEAAICYPDSVAYIALLTALNQQLSGYLEQSHYGRISAYQTQVAKTTFMDTKELYQPQYYMNHGTSPLGADAVPADAMGIAQALEEVFTNATLSLFSSTSFLQNETAAAPVPVTIFTPQNKFVYRSRSLLISYISGVVATAVCVLVGFLCISKTSSTAFSASFSTIMRTTRNPDLDALVSPADSSGAEPLGKGLAAIKLKLVRQGTVPALSRFQTSMDTGFGGHARWNGWTCFSVQEDVPSSKMNEKTDPPTSDVDLDSLLTPSEL